MPKTDEEILASLTPEQRAELDRLMRGEPIEGIGIDLDELQAAIGDPDRLETYLESLKGAAAKKP